MINQQKKTRKKNSRGRKDRLNQNLIEDQIPKINKLGPKNGLKGNSKESLLLKRSSQTQALYDEEILEAQRNGSISRLRSTRNLNSSQSSFKPVKRLKSEILSWKNLNRDEKDLLRYLPSKKLQKKAEELRKSAEYMSQNISDFCVNVNKLSMCRLSDCS